MIEFLIDLGSFCSHASWQPANLCLLLVVRLQAIGLWCLADSSLGWVVNAWVCLKVQLCLSGSKEKRCPLLLVLPFALLDQAHQLVESFFQESLTSTWLWIPHKGVAYGLFLGFFICLISLVFAFLLACIDAYADRVENKKAIVLTEEEKFKLADLKKF